jgi:hypothetical protein
VKDKKNLLVLKKNHHAFSYKKFIRKLCWLALVCPWFGQIKIFKMATNTVIMRKVDEIGRPCRNMTSWSSR